MELIVWIIFGGIVGWIASMVAGSNEDQGIFANIIVGIVGAVLGGYVSRMFGGEGVTGFNLTSFAVALVGAVVLLMVIGSFRSKTTR